MEQKHSQHKSFNFSILLFYKEGYQSHFVESSNGDSKKLFANAVPEGTKMSTKYAALRFNCDMKINGRVIE